MNREIVAGTCNTCRCPTNQRLNALATGARVLAAWLLAFTASGLTQESYSKHHVS